MAERSHKFPPIPAAIAVVVVLIGALIWWLVASTSSESSELAGTIEGDEYQVTTLVTGQITEVLVDEGTEVKAGDQLLRLDDTAAKLAVEQAEQAVIAAEAGVEKADTSADKKVAKAKLKQAKAAVKLAEFQVDYTTITAPISGRVTARLVNVGLVAAPGKNLITILDTGNLFVRVYVPETKVGQLQVGQTATLSGEGITAQTSGKISYIAAAAEFTPNTVQTADLRAKLVYEVRIAQLTDAGLRTGMPVEVKFA